MKVNVLITGMGQVIGIGILKALKNSTLDCSFIGTDCEPKSAGLYMVDKPFVVPSALDNPQEYIKNMAAICKREKVHIIFLGSEPEISIFAPIARDFFNETGTFVMVSPALVIRKFTDKWLTHQFLTAHGFPVPATVIPTERNADSFAAEYGFPLIIKPRIGYASRGVQVVDNLQQLLYSVKTQKNIILQEYVRPHSQEYTVGAFLTASGNCVGTFALRRELSAGVTFRAEVVQDKTISALCKKIAEKSGLIGPCNIQLIKTDHGPVVLEINPRFSSTVAIRAHFGFNEPAMAVENFIFHKTPTPSPISQGIALRYWEEKYINAVGDAVEKTD